MDERALRICDKLAGAVLFDADRLLDDARRVCWAAHFEDTTSAEQAQGMGVAALAVAVAAELHGLNVIELSNVIAEARAAMWQAAYAARRGAPYPSAGGAGPARH